MLFDKGVVPTRSDFGTSPTIRRVRHLANCMRTLAPEANVSSSAATKLRWIAKGAREGRLSSVAVAAESLGPRTAFNTEAPPAARARLEQARQATFVVGLVQTCTSRDTTLSHDLDDAALSRQPPLFVLFFKPILYSHCSSLPKSQNDEGSAPPQSTAMTKSSACMATDRAESMYASGGGGGATLLFEVCLST